MSFNPYQTKNAMSAHDNEGEDSGNESGDQDNETVLSTNEALFQAYITKTADEE